MADEPTVDIARRADGRFLPGQSPNPGGRAKESRAAIGRARELAPEAVEGLYELATNPKINASVRKDCWVAILDRGLGRPKASVLVDAPGMSRTELALEELSDDELRALVHGPAELAAE